MAFGMNPAGGFFGQLAQMRQANPNLWNAIGAGLASGPTFQQGFQNAAQMAPVAMQADRKHLEDARQKNATVAWAKQQGLTPEGAAFIENNPDAALALFKHKIAGGADGKTSLVPIWGEGPDGQPMLIQPTDSGTAVQMKMPEGFTPSKGVEKIDAGTEWLLYDKQSGQIVGKQPKNVAAEAEQKVLGEQAGAAKAGINATLAKASNALATIQSIKNDPNRVGGTGMTSVFNAIPGTGQYDFQQKVNQLKGQAFLDAFKDLKGGGQITNIEGEKATQAIARLETAQTEEGFLQALNELEQIIMTGIERAKATAAGQTVEPPASPASTGEQQSNWTDLGNGVKIRVKPQ